MNKRSILKNEEKICAAALILAITVSDKYFPRINGSLKTLLQQRDKLKNKTIRCKLSIIINAYWQARNQVNSLNAKSKKESCVRKILASKESMKEAWKTVNETIGGRSTSIRIDRIKDSGDNIVNEECIANKMNSLFCFIGKIIA